MNNWLFNIVMGDVEGGEIVYEVRGETKDIAAEKGRQEVYNITIVYLQKQSAFSPQGKLSRLGWEYLFGVVVFLFLALSS